MNKQEKKYIILIGDGMADFPIDKLDGKTPLQAARTPNMDHVASIGITGLARTVPEGMPPGSDTANLSIFGYNPEEYYTGRAPLEALNIGIDLAKNDVAFRCNLVRLKNNIMDSFTSGHIENEFSKIILEELRKENIFEDIEFHLGVSYRNSLVWRNYPHNKIPTTTPPHDIQDQNVEKYLPSGEGADILNQIMETSQKVISHSKKIQEAKNTYKGDPSSTWLWGGGKKPSMETLETRFGLRGYTISAVDLIHGIGIAAGLKPLHVEGATGYIDTNYNGKADACLEGLKDGNFIYLHVESPDESGHEGNLENKIKSIEDFDDKIVGRLFNDLKSFDDYTILIMPDHPTPISLKTHTDDAVPFCMYSNHGWNDESLHNKKAKEYDEESAKNTGLYIDKAHKLIELMINKKL